MITAVRARILAFALSLLSELCCANTTYQSAGSAYEVADEVIVAVILEETKFEAAGTPCGSRYLAQVQAPIKGNLRLGQTIAFGFLSGLETASLYKVYLVRDPSTELLTSVLEGRLHSTLAATQFFGNCTKSPRVNTIYIRAEGLDSK